VTADLERAVEVGTSALIDAEFYPPMFAEKVARIVLEAVLNGGEHAAQ